MSTKAWWKSKTFWFNVLSGLLLLIPDLPIDTKDAAIAIAVVNLLLRAMTSLPIGSWDQKSNTYRPPAPPKKRNG